MDLLSKYSQHFPHGHSASGSLNQVPGKNTRSMPRNFYSQDICTHDKTHKTRRVFTGTHDQLDLLMVEEVSTIMKFFVEIRVKNKSKKRVVKSMVVLGFHTIYEMV